MDETINMNARGETGAAIGGKVGEKAGGAAG